MEVMVETKNPIEKIQSEINSLNSIIQAFLNIVKLKEQGKITTREFERKYELLEKIDVDNELMSKIHF